MYLKLILIIASLVATIPVYALDCNKKPCHKKCINMQPEPVRTQCMCKSRKDIYYHFWGLKSGVPEYNPVCDGDFELYRMKYCAAKRKYDNWFLTNSTTRYTYTPNYDQLCDGSYNEYNQRIEQLKQNQALNNMADAIRHPVQVNVNHSGNVNHNIEFNGTIQHYNYGW